MPELPEVETIVRGLRPRLVGRRLVHCSHASTLMARCQRGSFVQRLEGQRCLAIDRHGKWIFMRLERGDTLAVHLGMTGALSIDPVDGALAPHTHLRIELGDETELRFCDPRRFGELLLLCPSGWQTRFGSAKLGPEATQIRVGQLRSACDRTRRPIKAILLDQRAVAGIGNIYADEILFDAGLHPGTSGRMMSAAMVRSLTTSIRRILRKAIDRRGSTIRDYRDADGNSGSFQKLHRVYGRAGAPCKRCRCAILLDRNVVSGRSTHYCPECQPMPRTRAQ